jgi:hypothetical protein
MPYIKEVCGTGDARVRYRCYKVCGTAGWDDLLHEAKADLCVVTEVDSVAVSLDGRGIPLSWKAKAYLERFGKKK